MSSNRFEFIAAALLGAVGVFVILLFRITVINGMFGYNTADLNPFYIIAGITIAAGALFFCFAVIAARVGKCPPALTIVGCAVICVGCLLDAVYSVIRRGSFHMSIQTLNFIFSAVLVGALAMSLYGDITRVLRPIIASAAISAVALISVFIPVFVGYYGWTDVLGMVAVPFIFGAIALVCAGYRNEDEENEKERRANHK